MELIELLKQYAKEMKFSEFQREDNYRKFDVNDHSLKDIDVWFRESDEHEDEHHVFETEEKAIEGMKGLIQFKQNVTV